MSLVDNYNLPWRLKSNPVNHPEIIINYSDADPNFLTGLCDLYGQIIKQYTDRSKNTDELW